MGAYLSAPVTTKLSSDNSNDKLSYGVSGMQGWRVSMEDAHTCILDYDEDTSLFAVYDGHGGPEVATYTAEHFPKFLKSVDKYKNGDLKECLVNGFLAFDKHLLDDEVMSELRNIAGMNNAEEEEENELASLAQDAEIPIEELLIKLKESGYNVQSNEAESDEESEDKEESSKAESSGTTSKEVVRKNEGEGSKGKGKKIEPVEVEQPAMKEEISEKNCEIGKEDGEEQEKKTEDEEKPKKSGEKMDEGGEDEAEESDDEEESEEEESDDEESELQCSDGDEVCYDSGTTAIVALLKKNRLVVGNVGDSRCVLCRNGVAIEMSQDHKPEDDKELTRIKNAGGRVTADGRVNGGLNLSRALGDHRYKSTSHLAADEQQITAMPDVKETEITEADRFLVLACDGIWNVLSSQDVVDFVNERLECNKMSLSKICEELFERCLADDTSGDGDGCDNMTAIIVLLNKDFNNKNNKRKLEEDQAENVVKKARTESE